MDEWREALCHQLATLLAGILVEKHTPKTVSKKLRDLDFALQSGTLRRKKQKAMDVSVEIQIVWDHWMDRFGPSKATLADARPHIEARLKSFSADDLVSFLDVIADEGWHRSQTPPVHYVRNIMHNDSQVAKRLDGHRVSPQQSDSREAHKRSKRENEAHKQAMLDLPVGQR